MYLTRGPGSPTSQLLPSCEQGLMQYGEGRKDKGDGAGLPISKHCMKELVYEKRVVHVRVCVWKSCVCVCEKVARKRVVRACVNVISWVIHILFLAAAI